MDIDLLTAPAIKKPTRGDYVRPADPFHVVSRRSAALNQSDRLGKIAPGASADLIAVPLEEPVFDPYEAVVFAEKPVCFSMIGGKVVFG